MECRLSWWVCRTVSRDVKVSNPVKTKRYYKVFFRQVHLSKLDYKLVHQVCSVSGKIRWQLRGQDISLKTSRLRKWSRWTSYPWLPFYAGIMDNSSVLFRLILLFLLLLLFYSSSFFFLFSSSFFSSSSTPPCSSYSPPSSYSPSHNSCSPSPPPDFLFLSNKFDELVARCVIDKYEMLSYIVADLWGFCFGFCPGASIHLMWYRQTVCHEAISAVGSVCPRIGFLFLVFSWKTFQLYDHNPRALLSVQS